MSAKNGTATAAAVKERAKEVMRMEVSSQPPFPRFKITIASYDGGTKLEISSNREEEISDLLQVWQPVIRPEWEEPHGPQANGEKTRYYGGDSCPLCTNKLVTRRGRRGRFIGCSNFPACEFTTSV